MNSGNELHGEESPVIFDDFDFDGNDDAAIRNGSKSPRGLPSYDIYLYDSASKKFIIHTELTAAAGTNTGLFDLDKTKNCIVTFSIEGCCWNILRKYSVDPKKKLVKVYEKEEDWRKTKDKYIVTERKLINGVWEVSTKKLKRSKS